MSRITIGVKLISLNKNTSVINIAKIAYSDILQYDE